MSTQTLSRNTAFTIRTTKLPTVCRHCSKYASVAPAWLKVLAAMAPGTGQAEQVMTVTLIADKAGLSRQRVDRLVKEAVYEKLLEKVKLPGATQFRRTWYGRQVLGRWKSAGWRE